MKGQNIYYINNVYVCIYVIYIYVCIYRERVYIRIPSFYQDFGDRLTDQGKNFDSHLFKCWHFFRKEEAKISEYHDKFIEDPLNKHRTAINDTVVIFGIPNVSDKKSWPRAGYKAIISIT